MVNDTYWQRFIIIIDAYGIFPSSSMLCASVWMELHGSNGIICKIIDIHWDFNLMIIDFIAKTFDAVHQFFCLKNMLYFRTV